MNASRLCLCMWESVIGTDEAHLLAWEMVSYYKITINIEKGVLSCKEMLKKRNYSLQKLIFAKYFAITRNYCITY